MKFNEMEVFANVHNEIVIRQVCGVVRITIDQAELVAEEIKRLVKELKEEAEGEEE